jgi:cobalt-precorrin 5A hydrolase
MNKLKIAIVTINKPSLNSAIKLNTYLDNHSVDIYTSKKTADLVDNLDENMIVYGKLDDIMPLAWQNYDAIICILAMGAVVRKIAPHLKGKDVDPAVIVINLALDKIVPLLSGHIGGANELSDYIANKIPGAINFISTATDQTKTLAFEVEATKNNWEIINLKALANISNRLLNEQIVNVATYQSIFDKLSNKKNLNLVDFKDIDENTVAISPLYKFNSNILHFRPKIVLGMGCNRGTSYNTIQDAFNQFLLKNNLEKKDIKSIASFDAKKDEIGLLEFARQNDYEIKFYQKDEINSLEQEFSKSASTKFFGLKGVAEPSAVLGSVYQELIIKKEVYSKEVTIAGAI